MAGNDELKIVVRAAVKDAIRDLGAVEQKIGSVASGAQRFAQRAGQVGQSLTRGLTLPLAGAGAAAVKFAADIEKQRTAFGVLLGDVERGAKLFEELKTFSASTPLQLDDITQASQTLLAFGTDAESVVDQIRMIGDVAQGDAEKLGRLSQAFGRVQAKGKASLEEINIFLEAGVPLIAQWSEQFGVAESEVFDMISAGEIGFADMQSALESLTGTGGQFEGMLEKMSETTSGKLSTAIDNLKLAAAELGEELLPMVNTLLDNATDLAQRFSDLDDGTQKLILGAGGIAAASGPAIRGIAGISRAVGFLAANPMVAAIAGATALAAGLTKLVVDWRAHRDLVRENARRGAENNEVLRATKIALNEVADATARSTDEQLRRLETMIAEQEVLGEYSDFELEQFRRERDQLREKMATGISEAEHERLQVVEEVIAEIETELAKRERAIELIEEQKRAVEERREAERAANEEVGGTGAGGEVDLYTRLLEEFNEQWEIAKQKANAFGDEFDLVNEQLRLYESFINNAIEEGVPVDHPAFQVLIEQYKELLEASEASVEQHSALEKKKVESTVSAYEAMAEAQREFEENRRREAKKSADAHIKATDEYRQAMDAAMAEYEDSPIVDDVGDGVDSADWIRIGQTVADAFGKMLAGEDSGVIMALRDGLLDATEGILNMQAPGLGTLARTLRDVWDEYVLFPIIDWASDLLGLDTNLSGDDDDAERAARERRERRIEELNELLDEEIRIRNEAMRELDEQFRLEFDVLRDQWQRNRISTDEFIEGMEELNEEYAQEEDRINEEVERIREILERMEDPIGWLKDNWDIGSIGGGGGGWNPFGSKSAGDEGASVSVIGGGGGVGRFASFSPSRGATSGGGNQTIIVSGDVYGVDDLYSRLEAAGRQLKRRGRVA